MNIHLSRRLQEFMTRIDTRCAAWCRLAQTYCGVCERRSPLRSWVGFGIIWGLVLLSLCIGGPFPIKASGHDTFTLLDGAWRIFQGQTPHKDFHTALGPVIYWLFALGMKIVGPTADSICVVYCIIFSITVSAATIVCSGRLPLVVSLLLGLWFGGVSASPALSGTMTLTSVGMIYNRIGYAWCGIVMIALFIPLSPQRRGLWSSIDAVIIGGICSSLFFLKITYGLALLPVLVLMLLKGQMNQRWLIVCGTSFISCVVLFLWSLDWSLSAVATDLRTAALAKKSVFNTQQLQDIVSRNSAVLASIFAVQTCRFVSHLQQKGGRRSSALVLGETLLILGIGGCLALGNLNKDEVAPWHVLLAVLVWGTYQELKSGRGRISRFCHIFALGTTLFVIAGVAANNYGGFAFAFVRKFVGTKEPVAFLPETLKTLRIPIGGAAKWWEGQYGILETNGYYRWGDGAIEYLPNAVLLTYQDQINDGCRLLNSFSSSTDKILVMDFTNPFSFALQRPSPRGDSVWWDDGINFSRKSHPSATEVFHDVDIVMVPKIEHIVSYRKSCARLLEVYGDELATHFTLVTESPWWKMLKRKQ